MTNPYDRILLGYLDILLDIVKSDDQTVKRQAVDSLTEAFSFLDTDEYEDEDEDED
jgi:hypothetical protein